MIEQRVSSRYARALLATTEQENVTEIIFKDFRFVSETLNESYELRRFTLSPVIPHWKKKEVYRAVFSDRINALTLTFLLFLIDKKRGDLILSIIIQYVEQYNTLNKLLPVEITSTIEMQDELKTSMLAKISEITGMTLLPVFNTNSDLQGGALVKIEDWIYDASIKHQLQLLRTKLASAELV